MLPAALEYPSGIEMVSMCTGLLGEEGREDLETAWDAWTPNFFVSSFMIVIFKHNGIYWTQI